MRTFILFGLIMNAAMVYSAPIATTPFIRIDQFGYLCNSRKVAVIVDPQIGYNAADSYTPGTGAGQYQLRRWDNDAVVFTGSLTAWNNGAIHTQSGDKGWWFDFSVITQPGSYYIFDAGTNLGSYKFDIGPNIYADVLKQASAYSTIKDAIFRRLHPMQTLSGQTAQHLKAPFRINMPVVVMTKAMRQLQKMSVVAGLMQVT